MGDATQELEGVLAGVVESTYRRVGGTQLKGLPGWLLNGPVTSGSGEMAL